MVAIFCQAIVVRTRIGTTTLKSGNIEDHGFFILFPRSEAICLSVYPAIHFSMHYPMDEKKRLAELLRLQEVAIPALSVLVDYGYLPHGGRGWWGSPTLQYHTYIIPFSYDLEDAVSFA